MQAVPEIKSGVDVDPSGRYSCPLCKAQSAGDEVDVGWVACPMLAGRMICLGCCLDHQKVARADDFENHPFHDLFDDLAKFSRFDVPGLRSICLRHQLESVEKQIQLGDPIKDLSRLKSQVMQILDKLASDW